MTLVKWNNRPVAKNFDHLFTDLFAGFGSPWANGYSDNGGFSPATNVHETSDAYHLELNVPGRSKDDFSVNVEKGLLTISYTAPKANTGEKNDDYKTIRREFGFRSFSRSFEVDDSIDTNSILARYENGLLKLLLPKKAEAKQSPKQITVE